MALEDLNPFAGRKKVKLTELLQQGAVEGLTVEFDASKDEEHNGENEVTDFPVEEGANITDHSRPKPRTLSIHAYVTGTPVSLLNISTPPGFKATRGKDAWEQMDRWRRDGAKLKATTTLFTYKDVVITKLSVPRNAQNADGIEFTVNLKEVFTASSKLVPKPVRVVKPEGSNVGQQPTKEATPPVQEQVKGLLNTGSDALGKFLGVRG